MADDNTYVPIETGTLANGAFTSSSATFVLEPGDSFQVLNTEQPFNVSIFYMELPIPPIRGQ